MGLAQYKNHKEKLQYPYNSKEWKQKVDEAHDLQQETQTHILDLLQKYTKESSKKCCDIWWIWTKLCRKLLLS